MKFVYPKYPLTRKPILEIIHTHLYVIWLGLYWDIITIIDVNIHVFSLWAVYSKVIISFVVLGLCSRSTSGIMLSFWIKVIFGVLVISDIRKYGCCFYQWRWTYVAFRGCTCTPHFLKFIKFVNKILYFFILFYLYLYNWTHWFYFL